MITIEQIEEWIKEEADVRDLLNVALAMIARLTKENAELVEELDFFQGKGV